MLRRLNSFNGTFQRAKSVKAYSSLKLYMHLVLSFDQGYIARALAGIFYLEPSETDTLEPVKFAQYLPLECFARGRTQDVDRTVGTYAKLAREN